ncbi:MAG TPA: hypothetical protein VIJ07_05155 [Dermatophilaceae bacterium]
MANFVVRRVDARTRIPVTKRASASTIEVTRRSMSSAVGWTDKTVTSDTDSPQIPIVTVADAAGYASSTAPSRSRPSR